jgi:hypothetical protein
MGVCHSWPHPPPGLSMRLTLSSEQAQTGRQLSPSSGVTRIRSPTVFADSIPVMPRVPQQHWRFRGNPEPDLVQAWFICERDVPIYSVSIPEHCVEAPLTAGGISGSGGRYFTVSPEWWGSWIVSSYTATNRLGSLTQVASSVYLNGSPY